MQTNFQPHASLTFPILTFCLFPSPKNTLSSESTECCKSHYLAKIKLNYPRCVFNISLLAFSSGFSADYPDAYWSVGWFAGDFFFMIFYVVNETFSSNADMKMNTFKMIFKKSYID